MNTNTKILSGGCLCRAVRFKISPPMRNIVACHCTQCRKSGGHYLAATSVSPENWTLQEEKGLRWFQSSKKAQRGFCYLCGSSLFWKTESGDRVSVFAGTLDDTANLRLIAHIFAADKGDYYHINEEPDVAIHAAGGLKLEL